MQGLPLRNGARCFCASVFMSLKTRSGSRINSGFCLYDEDFPIIYVNNTTAKTRQIFTLFHELAHLLFHTSGVDTQGDGFVNELAGDNQRIEVICNRMTACLLVPEETFDAAFAGQAPTEATATELGAAFQREPGVCVPKVSRPRSYHARRV